PAKLAQDVQLQFLGHLRQLGRAGRIENDLKRSHCLVEWSRVEGRRARAWLLAETGSSQSLHRVKGVSCTTCTKKQFKIMSYLYHKNRSPYWYIQYLDSDRKKSDN